MSKRFLKVVSVLLCLVIIFASSSFITAFAVTSTPISTKADLNNIRNNLSKNYHLTDDIVFTSEDFAVGGAFYNNGKGFEPIGTDNAPFTGTFDGRGHMISGLEINVSGSVYTITTGVITKGSSGSEDEWTGDYPIPPYNPIPTTVSPTIGLFGSNRGTISNLCLSNSTISGTSSNNVKLYIGGIVGHNKGIISDCAVSASLTGTQLSYVGGIAGYQTEGSITNCVSMANITSTGFFAGIAGGVAAGDVTASYSAAIFSGTKSAAFNSVSHTLNLGGFYIADEDSSGVGTRIATTDKNMEASYVGFDFSDTWYMDTTINMPYLYVFNVKPGDIDGNGSINLNDVVALAQYLADWDVDIKIKVANVNKDKDASTGVDLIDLNDVVYLAQYLAGWDNIVL